MSNTICKLPKTVYVLQHIGDNVIGRLTKVTGLLEDARQISREKGRETAVRWSIKNVGGVTDRDEHIGPPRLIYVSNQLPLSLVSLLWYLNYRYSYSCVSEPHESVAKILVVDIV